VSPAALRHAALCVLMGAALNTGLSLTRAQAQAPVGASAARQVSPDSVQELSIEQVLQAAGLNLDVAVARREYEAAQADIVAADHAPLPVLSAKAGSIDLQNGVGAGPLFQQKRIDKSVGLDWTWERGNKRALRTLEAQREALGILDQLVLDFLTLGEYELVAYTLREAAAVAKHDGVAADVQAGLRELPARLSEANVVSQLLHALDESARTPVASLLEGLFAELRPSALEPLVGWLGAASASPARAAIERASLRLAGANTAELAKLLESPLEFVVRGALRLVGQLATPAAVPGLSRLLRGPDVKLRAEAVTALSEIGSPSALQALERALEDADREVRVATYRAIGARKHTAALPRLLDAIRRKEIRAADLGEKMALFEAFGGLCGDAGVAELDGILNARGLLGAKETPEMRACAARALGLVGTRTAMAALQKSAETKDVVVRSAVARAMRGGT